MVAIVVPRRAHEKFKVEFIVAECMTLLVFKGPPYRALANKNTNNSDISKTVSLFKSQNMRGELPDANKMSVLAWLILAFHSVKHEQIPCTYLWSIPKKDGTFLKA